MNHVELEAVRRTACAMVGVAMAGAALLWTSAASADFRERYAWLRETTALSRGRCVALAVRGAGLTISDRLAVWRAGGSVKDLASSSPPREPPKGARGWCSDGRRGLCDLGRESYHRARSGTPEKRRDAGRGENPNSVN